MLTLQYVKKYGLENLKKKFCIEVKTHSELPLVILNYNQYNSPKNEPIVRECRQLVLDLDEMKIVGRSFERFFNLNEDVKETSFLQENVSKASFQTKHDGSLIQLFYSYDKWNIITRSSFATHIMCVDGPTWENAVMNLLPNGTEILDRNYSYIFELCTRWNIVVRNYPTSHLFLLASFNIQSGVEVADRYLDNIAVALGVDRPFTYNISSLEEAMSVIKSESDKDKGFEGFVAKIYKDESKYIRVKIKSEEYLKLHYETNGSLTWKSVVPLILKNEFDEIRSVSRYKNILDEIYDKYMVMRQDIFNEWEKYRHHTDIKYLALDVKKHRYSGLFFILFKSKKNLDDDFLRENQDVLVKLS